MPRGKSPNIADVKRIVYLQLQDYTNAEIADELGLNVQTVQRIKSRSDYTKIRKYLAEILLSTSSSELLRL